MGNRELKITLEFSPTVIDTEGLPLPENIQYLLVFCEKTEAGGKLRVAQTPFHLPAKHPFHFSHEPSLEFQQKEEVKDTSELYWSRKCKWV